MSHRRENEEIVVLADLHMSAGLDPVTGSRSRLEDFHNDRSFAAFIDWRLQDGRRRARPWRLLILGDLLDFTRVELGAGRGRRRLDMSEDAALAKLDLIESGHPLVFTALRKLAAAGIPVDIVPGNHDLELLHPRLAQRLRQLLTDRSREGHAGVAIHPWIFRIPGLLYAEHGHQHHDINRFPGMLRDGAAHGLDPPLGSHLAEWMCSIIEAASHTEPVQPSLAAVAVAARRHPLALASAMSAHVRLWHALRRFAAAHRVLGTRAVHTSWAAKELSLSADTVESLHLLGATSATATGLRLIRTAGERARRRPDGEGRSRYMRDAAARVHAILTMANEPAPFYAFAHTHVGETAALPGPVPATYLNTGTWSTLQRDPSAAPTFLEIRGDRQGDARLRRWDSAAGEARNVPARAPSAASPPRR